MQKKLSKLKVPKIKKNKKIDSKYDRTVLSLIEDFKNHIPIVVSDESNVNELHAMRKILKKLRYVLELDQENSYHSLVLKIKQLQQILGNIHDCDIFIGYFEDNADEIPGMPGTLQDEKAKRHASYDGVSWHCFKF